ncbi:MAG TPA: dioxygenase [Candidatus Acidoferrales bacterium]|nr:dioxygenase [Candidatus Acidoferrales bacterium]
MPYATEENLTDLALKQWEACHSPRMRQIMQSLVRHLHGFVRDVDLTQEEWLMAVDWLARTGKLCTDKRQEFILLSDVLGISMLVDAINHRFPEGATPTTVVGPFHIDDSPELPMGADLAEGIPGETCFLVGTVSDLEGKPIEGAKLDIWQADADGMYESQLGAEEPRLRAIFHTGPDGKYLIRTIAPPGYSIPMDGTVGDLLRETDISHFRPAHIHFLITAPGYETLVTHLFKKGTRYIDSDIVFGVKDKLIVEFKKYPAGKTPTGEISSEPFVVVNYDFVLSKAKRPANAEMALSETAKSSR